MECLNRDQNSIADMDRRKVRFPDEGIGFRQADSHLCSHLLNTDSGFLHFRFLLPAILKISLYVRFYILKISLNITYINTHLTKTI